MKHRLPMLAITGLLALSACGQSSTPTAISNNTSGTPSTPSTPSTPTTPTTPAPGTPTQPPKPQEVVGCATITVDLDGITPVNGVTTAPVIVTDSSGAEAFNGTANDLEKLSKTFPAGTYSVKAGTLQGYTAQNSPQSVTLDCDANKDKTVLLSFKTTAVTQAKVASLAFTASKAVTDGDLQDLPSQQEKNNNKNVMLYASQTEEPVLVSMMVKDASGAPVAGAAVNVQVDSPSVAIIGGHVSGLGSVAPQGVQQGVAYSDDQGMVRFTAYATSAPASGAPVKFVVSAVNDGGAALKEFKAFFLNMSHLYYQGNTNFGASATIPSKQRLGGNVGSFENNWIDPAQRTHAFTTVAYAKQPQGGPSVVGGRGSFPGFMEYSVSGPSMDRVFLTTSSSANSGDSTLDSAGQPVYLKTRDDVKAAELGLNVQVNAEYHYTPTYGSTTYDFPLKSYVFSKAFTGTILSIRKTGPDIETWTGYGQTHDAYRPDDVTLLPAMDPGNLTPSSADNFTVGRTYEYKITVTNTGKTVARNVIARDVLPAELGFVQGSVNVTKGGTPVPNGNLLATYNAQRHAFNLSFTGGASIGELQPGESFDITFRVYPRQKPGYAWNDNNRDGQSDGTTGTGAYGENAPRDGYYEDPYLVKNRAKASAENAFEVDAYKDIHVVRPVLTIEKYAQKQVVYTNQPVKFDISVRVIDRSTEDPNPEVRAGYAALGDIGAIGEGFAYKARLEDSYGYNLDFVNAYDENGNRVTTFEQLGTNTLALNLPDVMIPDYLPDPVRRRVEHRLTTVFQAENSVKGPNGKDSAGRGANVNCARLYAWNLNQPYNRILEDAGLKAQAQRPVFPPLSPQYEGLYRGFFPINLDGNTSEFLTNENGIDRAGRNYLIDCDYVYVLDRPSFDLRLFDAARGTNGLTDYTVNPNRLTDAQSIPQGSYYEYDFSYTNESADSAHNVRSSMTLPTFASLNDLGVVYTHLGTPYTYSMAQVLAGVTLPSGATLTATRAGDTVSMRVSEMGARDTLFAQFVMYANQAGSGKAVSSLDWDENTNGSPLAEEEYTRVVLR